LGETAVTELAKPFAMSLPAVSKHLKVLERAGLIARGREAQWRPCRIEPRALKDIDDWLNHYRRFFDESFDRLDAYLQKLQGKDRDQERIKERSNDQPNGKRKSRRNKRSRS
jgi:DNA-binding transcriptional regulator GbsR (MarR family)